MQGFVFDEACVPVATGGARVAFTSARDGTFEIYVIDANGQNLTNLTGDAAAADFQPSFGGGSN